MDEFEYACVTFHGVDARDSGRFASWPRNKDPGEKQEDHLRVTKVIVAGYWGVLRARSCTTRREAWRLPTLTKQMRRSSNGVQQQR